MADDSAPSDTIWFNAARTRFFALPEGVVFPDGELSLRNARGQHFTLDEAAALPHEVPAEEANARLQAELRVAVSNASAAFKHMIDLGKTVLSNRKVEGEEAPKPGAMAEAFAATVSAAAVAGSEAVGNPASAPGAREKLGEIRADLAEELQKAEPAVERLGQALQSALTGPEVQGALSSLGQQLQNLARSLGGQPKTPPEAPRPAEPPTGEPGDPEAGP